MQGNKVKRKEGRKIILEQWWTKYTPWVGEKLVKLLLDVDVSYNAGFYVGLGPIF